MKITTLLLALTIVACAPKTENAPPDDAISHFIEQQMDSAGGVGMAAAVLVGKEVVWTRGFGYADFETRKPFTPNTIMNISSITKPSRARQ